MKTRAAATEPSTTTRTSTLTDKEIRTDIRVLVEDHTHVERDRLPAALEGKRGRVGDVHAQLRTARDIAIDGIRVVRDEEARGEGVAAPVMHRHRPGTQA